jgi:6-pyruvoyl-tetrahydropterin synthase
MPAGPSLFMPAPYFNAGARSSLFFADNGTASEACGGEGVWVAGTAVRAKRISVPYFVTCAARFGARHALRGRRGRVEPLHAHRFQVRVCVRAERLDRFGVAVDFVELQERLRAETRRLAGRTLNRDARPFAGAKGISPSAENLARFFHRRLRSGLPKGARLVSVTVTESAGCEATYLAR